MLRIRNITIVYFVTLWFLYNTSIFSPLFFWIAIPAYIIIPVLASLFICSNLYLKAICRGPKDKNIIVVSFNIPEPDEKWNYLQGILSRQKVPAIFFVTGKVAEKTPELVYNLAKAGNIIGNHSYSASSKFGFYSARRLLTDLHKTEELIYETTGNEVDYFRPPLGITNPALRKATGVIQYNVIGWSKRIKISHNPKKVSPLKGIKNGNILRIDFTGDQIPDSFEKLIIELKENFSIVSIDELMQLRTK